MRTTASRAEKDDTSTSKFLIQKYGPSLSIDEVATILRRTPEGLRFTLRGNSEFAKKLQAARRKMGRRVIFETLIVASILEGE